MKISKTSIVGIILIPAFIAGLTMMMMTGSKGTDPGDITPEVAKRYIDEGKIDLILDVRSPQEWNGPLGRIKDSKLIPVQVLSEKLDDIKDYKDKTILVYCHVGSRSSYSQKLMEAAGFNKVLNLNGGIVEWKRKGYGTVKG
ncbi:hypothetical protein MNBD_NITROSPINAE04-1474 [hydrothermal vent metagenome]|uniref:Rhodanese domain-containing protein n=1 Tax=hydrothermal vent metagenome TaxID=652676 RepID=A0A3B1CNP3_9ZZZZ